MIGSKPSKRERTRDGLLIAAQQLLLDGGSSALSVSELTSRAGVAHGTFYNHFDSIDQVIDGVGQRVLFEHARVLDELLSGVTDRADRFALSTRQTLRMLPESPGYGRLVFDSGLPVDRLSAGIRARMHADVLLGIDDGAFKVADVDLTVSILAGALVGLLLDLHRGHLGTDAIELATQRLLLMLGVAAPRAHRLAFKRHRFLHLRPLPLSGLSPAPESR